MPETNSAAHHERMWGKFHQLRTSKTFQTLWEDFLKTSTTVSPNPIFYQYVADSVLVKESFPALPDVQLESEDKDDLWYAAVYSESTMQETRAE